jgi:hypothetical protein
VAIHCVSPDQHTDESGGSDRNFAGGAWPFWASAGLYLTLVVLLHPLYRYHINPDATSYDSLAQKWANGNWYEGITGHWAPLLIWLLALAKKLGLGQFASVTMVDALGAIISLAGLDRLCKLLSLNELRRFIALSLASIWVVAFTFDEVTPDLLLCASLTWYLALVVQGDYLVRPSQAALLGLTAAIAYLTKPYAIGFIFLHLAITSIAKPRSGRIDWRLCVRQGAILGGIVLLLAGSWVGLMSFKYQHFTTGSAGTMSFRIISPRWSSIYVNNIGLREPPNDTAVSYWEDPEVEKLGLPNWSPFESLDSFFYYLRLIASNIGRIGLWWLIVSIAAIPVLATVVWRWLRAGRPLDVALILVAIAIYPAGYALLFISNRYLWPQALWTIVLLASVVPLRVRSAPSVVLLCVSFLPYPLFCLSADRGQGTAEYTMGTALRRHGVAGRSASTEEWHRSLYVSYHAGLQYCGVTAGSSAPIVSEELREIGIRYLFVWPGSKMDMGRQLGLRQIQDSDFGQLKIYAVDWPGEQDATSHAGLRSTQ